LNENRRANWQIVNAIKAMKEMQGNIDRSICSDNEYIRSEYNSIRLNIASVQIVVMKKYLRKISETPPCWFVPGIMMAMKKMIRMSTSHPGYRKLVINRCMWTATTSFSGVRLLRYFRGGMVM
jgi:hypothetical protein